VALARRAFIFIRRLALRALAPALLALSLCSGAFVATAPAATPAPLAQPASSHATQPPKPRRHRSRCARRASFHTVTGKPPGTSHRRTRRAGCRRRRHRPATHRHSAPRHASGACANVTLIPSDSNLALIRASTLCLVNRERTSRGERALNADRDLEQAAQAHSQDMAAGDYFEHDGRGGSTPLSRMRAAGYIFSSRLGYAIGENIAWATLWLATPKAIVTGWMASPGHRANILDATFRDTGVGVSPHPLASLAHGQSGGIYTQDFGRIIAP
jgi:uncharacterized protein YkwD